MSGTPQRSKRPPIRPVWVVAAAIGTVVLLALTTWRALTPPPVALPPKPAATGRSVSDTKPTTSPSLAKGRIAEHAARMAAERAHRAEGWSSVDTSHTAADSATKARIDVARDLSSPMTTPARVDAGASQGTSAPAVKEADHRATPAESGQPPHIAESPSSPVAKQPAIAKPQDANETIVEALQAKATSGDPRPAPGKEEAKKTEAADHAADDARWLAAARQFAARHKGLVLEARPFPAGELTVSGGFEPSAEEQPFWFLGGGKLETQSGVYLFGPGYEQAAPVMRQELPQVAAALGLASVGVELHHRGNDLVIRAVATPKPNGPEAIAEKRNESARLQNKRDRLNYQLREWQKVADAGDSAEAQAKKATVREAILAVLETPAQASMQPASSGPRKIADSPAPAAKSQSPPEESVTARDRILYSPETLARNEIAKLDVRIRQLQAECNAALSRSHDADDQAVQKFEEDCRKITVVIYQSVKALSGPAEASPAAPAKRLEPTTPRALSAQPPQRAEADAATPADLKPTKDVAQWPVEYRFETAESSFTPTYTEMAQLTVQAASASGSALPKWFHDGFSVNCTVCEFAKEGKPRLRDLTGADKPKACNISTGTTQIGVRFWLSRKIAAADGSIRPVAETPWHVVDAVRSGAVYRLKAPLTQQMLLSLQSKPTKPIKETKPARSSSQGKSGGGKRSS